MIIENCMPNGGRLPLDVFVIGESTPDRFSRWAVGGMASYYFLRRAGFNTMSLEATGEHSSFCKISSP